MSDSASKDSVSNPSADDKVSSLTDETANVTFFKKKGKANKNAYKRKHSSGAELGEEGDGSAVVTKERKLDTSNPLVQGTRKGKRTIKEDIHVTYVANKSAMSLVPHDVATRTAEWDTETDRDAQALLEKKLAAEEVNDNNLYKGQNSYKTYIKKRDTAAGNAASSKIKAGPIRAPTNIRVTSRFDYQPDICKDYKETGYCGYGDSCKFLHDRGDYKTGWQLEKEWEEMNGKLRKDPNAFLVESSDEEELPFACLICRQEFKDPVVTKCGHYFCEKCALQNYSKNQRCFACGSPTNGIFNTAKNILQKLHEKKKGSTEKQQKEDDNKETNNESDSSDGDDGSDDEIYKDEASFYYNVGCH